MTPALFACALRWFAPIALLAQLCALIGPRCMCMSSSKDKDASIGTMRFVEAYTAWSVDNMDADCPASLAELTRYMNSKELEDPWGTPYVPICFGERFESDDPCIGPFGVISAGPDAAFGTRDDITSWRRHTQGHEGECKCAC